MYKITSRKAKEYNLDRTLRALVVLETFLSFALPHPSPSPPPPSLLSLKVDDGSMVLISCWDVPIPTI